MPHHMFLPTRRQACLAGLSSVVGLSVVGLTPRRIPAAPVLLGPGNHPFLKNVKVSFTETHMIVESDGIPNHQTANYPNKDNPNRILKQSYKFQIPLRPRRAAESTRLPMGPIGVAINGIPFYNPYNREGRNAVEGVYAEVFDSCCGHPDPMGRYHYHKYPVCVKSPFRTEPGEHSPIIGYAFDGYPICGPNDDGGQPAADLDNCNGHEDETRGYHYHVTRDFPYILGAYRGEVEYANFDRPPQGRGRGRPPGGPGRGPAEGAPGRPPGGEPGERGGPGRGGPPPGRRPPPPPPAE